MNRLGIIRKSEQIQNDFDLLYDFTLIKATSDTAKRGFISEVPLKCIGSDACGGTYAIVGEDSSENLPIAFISSEGQGGIIAKDFENFLKLLIDMPFWLDVLKFSGNGQLKEMERAYSILIKEMEQDMKELLEDDGDPRSYKMVQKNLKTSLKLEDLKKPTETLQDQLLKNIGFQVADKKTGKLYTSLFSPYIVTDNPMWKNK